MDSYSYLTNAGIDYVENLYNEYLTNPGSVDQSWGRFFEGFELARKQNGHAAGTGDTVHLQKEISVLNLINAYRQRGHLFADLNPILPRPAYEPPLDLATFGLTDAELDTLFQAGVELTGAPMKLKDIVALLKETYCGKIGVEFKYIRIPKIVEWFQKRLEKDRSKKDWSREERLRIVKKMAQATSFESFIHRKFVGQKRFSLEGAESVIPALDGVITHGSDLGIQEFVIGMAHRGRLNVLTNILQKEYDVVFGEFSGKGIADDNFDGDVKYHMGFSSDPKLHNGKTVHLSLVPNPSHLEAVDPVVVGVARARMDKMYGGDHDMICPILIHGDAALAGQGVVYELIQMSRLPGYEVGGTIHIVINNQVGFTTDQSDARSSTYCTDVAKVTLSPVFHVNGDDPEAVMYATLLAMEFRQEFNRDVFIDVICYRRYGHNEGDEPRFTQPKMYAAIDKHPIPYKVYTDSLLAAGAITQADIDKIDQECADHLNSELEQTKTNQYSVKGELGRAWKDLDFYDNHKLEPNPDTKVSDKLLKDLAKKITTIPESFAPHRNIKKNYEDRLKMVTDANAIDWGMGENLAYAALLHEGHDIRFTGQDVERGTFTHRHAVINDQNTNEKYCSLNTINPEKAQLRIFNSLLSEYAVMGFEYGYASAMPQTLTIWEAQFGDFVNGAQIIIDQFLSASKTKWQRMNGLVLLLPHGYEGQGPEHSSARLERMLVLCAENNMFVLNCTTPANLFHALRRQVKAKNRRPLVVFTPKSLLRLPACVSKVEEFTKQGFHELYDDSRVDAKKVTRVVLCTGKLYYDLLAQQEAHKVEDVAIVRLEQIYPLPIDQLEALKKTYPKAKNWVWAQEEPINMGAWPFLVRKLYSVLPLEVVGRKESASPATGSPYQHKTQQEYIIRKALDLKPDAVIK
jgi:2-oxoglutarate dehydrogenase E1 component